MPELKLISKEYLPKVFRLAKDYLPGNPPKSLKKWYVSNPLLFVGYYVGDKLVGMAFGREWDTHEILLQGIAVRTQYWQKGIGRKLLTFFSKQVKKAGKSRIGVASADIDWVEKFYLKAGFEPVKILIQIPKPKFPSDYKKRGFKIDDVRDEGNKRKLYVQVKQYDIKFKDAVKKAYPEAKDVNYIMEKKV